MLNFEYLVGKSSPGNRSFTTNWRNSTESQGLSPLSLGLRRLLDTFQLTSSTKKSSAMLNNNLEATRMTRVEMSVTSTNGIGGT